MVTLLPVLLFYYNLINNGDTRPEIIQEFITVESLIVGVDPQLAKGIVKNESQFNCGAEGDYSTSTKKYTSFGCWQIHLPDHKDITPTQAKDPIFSTEWALKEIKSKGCGIWSTCKIAMASVR